MPPERAPVPQEWANWAAAPCVTLLVYTDWVAWGAALCPNLGACFCQFVFPGDVMANWELRPATHRCGKERTATVAETQGIWWSSHLFGSFPRLFNDVPCVIGSAMICYQFWWKAKLLPMASQSHNTPLQRGARIFHFRSGRAPPIQRSSTSLMSHGTLETHDQKPCVVALGLLSVYKSWGVIYGNM